MFRETSLLKSSKSTYIFVCFWFTEIWLLPCCSSLSSCAKRISMRCRKWSTKRGSLWQRLNSSTTGEENPRYEKRQCLTPCSNWYRFSCKNGARWRLLPQLGQLLLPFQKITPGLWLPGAGARLLICFLLALTQLSLCTTQLSLCITQLSVCIIRQRLEMSPNALASIFLKICGEFDDHLLFITTLVLSCWFKEWPGWPFLVVKSSRLCRLHGGKTTEPASLWMCAARASKVLTMCFTIISSKLWIILIDAFVA